MTGKTISAALVASALDRFALLSDAGATRAGADRRQAAAIAVILVAAALSAPLSIPSSIMAAAAGAMIVLAARRPSAVGLRHLSSAIATAEAGLGLSLVDLVLRTIARDQRAATLDVLALMELVAISFAIVGLAAVRPPRAGDSSRTLVPVRVRS